MRPHAQTVREQFDPQAAAYLSSTVHAAGPDLDWVRAAWLTHLGAPARALDAGCGAGHLGFALARCGAAVAALDPSPAMLATVAAEAGRTGLPIETCLGRADALPFATACFDLVATRYSAHHWHDLPVALRAFHRVLCSGGRLLVIDVLGAEDPLVDTHLQAMELLRDPSHLRNRAAGEWRRLLADAGFEVVEEKTWPLRLVFDAWIARMRTPDLKRQAILALQADAPAEVRAALDIAADGSFSVRTGAFVAVPRPQA